MQLKKSVPVIILAGGFGTRLRHVVQDVPKPMAPINGRPFLEILLDYLVDQQIERVILATGHQADVIKEHFGNRYSSIQIFYSHETTPLGTGGAIKQAFEAFDLDEAIVLNGDTFFPVSLARLQYFHHQFNSDVTLSIKYLIDFNRYGTLKWNAFNRVEQFNEKMACDEGWINGGIYYISKNVFDDTTEQCFSFETDVLEKHVTRGSFYTLPDAAYFIDIGIPEDYEAFQQKNLQLTHINNEPKTYFIDRDGVINKRIPGDYVRSIDQFHFLFDVKTSLKQLSDRAKHIIIVTNQQGIGKGLMTESQLDQVHSHMVEELESNGVKIDSVYFAKDLATDLPPDRKPNIGMALKAKEEHPDIDWSTCVMIGDSTSDIEFGLRMGMHTILVGNKSDTELAHEKFADLPSAINQFIG